MNEERIRYFLCGDTFSKRWRPHIRAGEGLLSALQDHAEVENAEDAQLLVASENLESLKEFHKVRSPFHFRLQLCLEAIFPDFNFFDWAISFVPDDLGGRNFRPHPHLIFAEAAGKGNAPFSYPIKGETPGFHERKFSDFIYSNPNAHPFRDSFFHSLNAQLAVSSLGRHLNGGNFAFATGTDFQTNWVAANISAKRNYRFSIAIENADFEGYTSEKLLTSFAAGSVPLYWGNRHVTKDFNEARFINLRDFDSQGSAVDFVVSIAENRAQWEEIVSQPVFNRTQKEALKLNRLDLAHFFGHIVESVETGVARRGVGYWPTRYSDEINMYFPRTLVFSTNRLRPKLIAQIRRTKLGDALLTKISEVLFRILPKGSF